MHTDCLLLVCVLWTSVVITRALRTSLEMLFLFIYVVFIITNAYLNPNTLSTAPPPRNVINLEML